MHDAHAELIGGDPGQQRPKWPNEAANIPIEDGVDEPISTPPSTRKSPRKARRARLTDDLYKELLSESEAFYVWDVKHKGLGIRVGTSGTRAYVLKIPLPGKRSKWLTLDATSLAEAITEYHDLLAKFGKGDIIPKRPQASLWQDVVNHFEAEHTQGLKPSTVASYKSALKLIRAAFFDRPVRSITFEDLKTWHANQTHRKRQANVCINLCKLIFDRAEARGLRDVHTNPVDLLEKSNWVKYPEVPRDVRLTDDQILRIGVALNLMESHGEESIFTIAAVRLLFFTGRRLREILNLKWHQVNLSEGTLILTDHKTDGSAGTITPPLNSKAIKVLLSLPRLTYIDNGVERPNPYVLPGALPGQQIKDLRKFWARLSILAGVEQVFTDKGQLTTFRRHDLRHAHGNESANLNMSLQTTAELLAHQDPQSSARYSKPGRKPALAASQKVANSLHTKMGNDE